MTHRLTNCAAPPVDEPERRVTTISSATLIKHFDEIVQAGTAIFNEECARMLALGFAPAIVTEKAERQLKLRLDDIVSEIAKRYAKTGGR